MRSLCAMRRTLCVLLFRRGATADENPKDRLPGGAYRHDGRSRSDHKCISPAAKRTRLHRGEKHRHRVSLDGGKGTSAEAEQARELVRLNVDVLFVSAYPAIRAAKETTKTIPIVMVTTQDPVASGLIDSLARPGGNVTGVTQLARELSGKRLELLLEMVPSLSRIGLIVTKDSINTAGALKRYENAARALKVEHRVLEIGSGVPTFRQYLTPRSKRGWAP